jgi:hypothetical protein
MGYSARAEASLSRVKGEHPMRMSLHILLLGAITLAPKFASANWIDIETPLDKRTTTSFIDGTVYELVGFAVV